MSPTEEDFDGAPRDDDMERWALYRKLILTELKRLNTQLQTVQTDVHEIQIQMAMISIRAGFFGAAAGLVGGFILQKVLERL